MNFAQNEKGLNPVPEKTVGGIPPRPLATTLNFYGIDLIGYGSFLSPTNRCIVTLH